MTREMQSPTELAEWQALHAHHLAIRSQHMRRLFQDDPARFAHFSLRFDDMLFDFSRNRITRETIPLLTALATASGLSDKISGLFSGQILNTTEKRAALHTALRDKKCTNIRVDGVNIAQQITDCLTKMRTFTQQIQSGSWRGVTGKPIQSVITVGVGGSYLGTMMCCHALSDFKTTPIRFHFISSVDDSLLADTLDQVDPETTLIVISSKTFTTMETMTNARTLLSWMQNRLGHDALRYHFIAITAAAAKAKAFGIPDKNIFPLWEWVGGRYSIWSSVGLPLMLMIGADRFQAFLDGAYAMDQHFRQTAFDQNMPVLLALLSIWYRNFFHASAQAIVPYAHRLRHLVPYLQQADMESNGKRTRLRGQEADYATGPVIFGEEGCNGQHSYHQLLHQGQHLIPVDFILIGSANHNRIKESAHHHDILLASGLSQAQALMRGKTYDEALQALRQANVAEQDALQLAHHHSNPGNRPSNILFLDQLNPKSLGSLIALYEHKIFCQGIIWDINSFDQWGVELGKQLLPDILHTMHGRLPHDQTDSATAGLIHHFSKTRESAA